MIKKHRAKVMNKLQNKTAIITGASRGLGLEIAKEYSRNGADLVICSRNRDAIEAAAAQIRNCRSDVEQAVIPVAADITDEDDIDNVIKTAVKELGGLDVLVNNAAIQGPIGRIENNDWGEWKRTISADLTGPAYLMRCAIGHFKKNGRHGKIINISGGGATGSRPNFSAYAAAKTAIVRLTEILADENKDYGIDINAIAPGAMRSAMTDEILNAGESAGEKEIQTANKLISNGDDSMGIAVKLALFLAGDESNGITGRLISAKWDKWDLFPKIMDELPGSDVYTLRRISARDRGYDWDV